MTACTDDERREVARRLRDKKAECEERGYPWMCDDLILALGYDHDYEAGDEIFDRLADLIEPSIPKDPGKAGLACVDAFIREMRHSTEEERGEYSAMLKKMSVELHPVDRDALLALADDMDRDGKIQRGRQKAGERWFIDGLDVREYARRIREALGVSE